MVHLGRRATTDSEDFLAAMSQASQEKIKSLSDCKKVSKINSCNLFK